MNFAELVASSFAKVSFQWKNPDFLLKNPDFVLKNVEFTIKYVDIIIKTGQSWRLRKDIQR